jgi:uncharacterized glyoxalase superfamily protein PhnB
VADNRSESNRQDAPRGGSTARRTTGEAERKLRPVGEVFGTIVTAELTEEGFSIRVAGRTQYGTMGRATSVSLDLEVENTEEGKRVRKALEDLLEQEMPRLSRRLQRDAATAFQQAVVNGEEEDDN